MISKYNKDYKKRALEGMDDIMLDRAGRNGWDIKDHKEDILDFSWDNITSEE